MSNRGGQRIGAGRKPGSQNKVTLEQRATLTQLAQTYSDDAIKSLHKVATEGKSESARVSAAVAILDRAFGKPVQTIDSTIDVEDTTKHDPMTDIELARGLNYILREGAMAKEKLEKAK